MSYLNPTYNQTSTWEDILQNAKRRIEVDLMEVERVLELSRRTPKLAEYEEGLQKLSIFFEVATKYYQKSNPEGLTQLVEFWERYRSVVIQRYTAITPVELSAADKIVKDVFQTFLDGVPNENITYSKSAAPLVYGGSGGLSGYFTHPPSWNRPFAIINLPHTAFDNVWQWLALPHETGHDTYASVKGLDIEIQNALMAKMEKAVSDGLIAVPDVDVDIDLNAYNIPHQIKYSGEELLSKIWQSWANEAQADIIGLLSCGGAAIIALQQIIGFEASDQWMISQGQYGLADAPEVHPTSYIRNMFNIAALRQIGHVELADEIQSRFDALKPQDQFITWRLDNIVEVVKVPVNDMVYSANLAAEVLLTTEFESLGGQTFRDLIDFTIEDQLIVDAMSDKLINGDPTFAQVDNSTARHALAATIFAFEKDRTKSKVINRTFKHFI